MKASITDRLGLLCYSKNELWLILLYKYEESTDFHTKKSVNFYAQNETPKM